VHHGPADEEGRLHIEEQEQEGHHVEPDPDYLGHPLLEGNAAFIRGKLVFHGLARAEEPGEDHDPDRNGKHEQDIEDQVGSLGFQIRTLVNLVSEFAGRYMPCNI